MIYSAKITRIKTKIDKLPRLHFACLPTPIEKLDKFSKKLGISDIYIKRDDQTGLAFGGNKTRKLEFILADAVHQGASSVITWGGIQSNWCRQVAAGANKYGLKSILILFKQPNSPKEYDGNYLLDFILDAKIELITVKKSCKIMELKHIKKIVDKIIKTEIKNGETPYVIPVGGSLVEGSLKAPLGAISYVNTCYEIFSQMRAKKLNFNSIVVATSSGATHAGLIVGAKILFPQTKIIGISCGDNKKILHSCVKKLAAKTIQSLDIKNVTIRNKDVIIFDDYTQEGYGVINKNIAETIRLLAKTEGIFLDPVYTAKAMTGLIDLARKGFFRKNEKILFLHTGGAPLLFPYKHHITHFLRK